MAQVLFKRGLQAALPTTASDGVFYLTTDTHRLYVGHGTKLVPVNEGVVTVSDINHLPASATPGEFFYAAAENVLCVYNGTQFVQMNPDTGATSVEVVGTGNAVTAASYDASTRKLTLTKGATFATKSELDAVAAVKRTVYTKQSDATDIATLSSGITAKQGDLLVVTSVGTADGSITGKKSCYEYSGTEWIACDGFVDAKSVILNNDIVTAGEYTQVGNITKANTNATGTFAVKGKSVQAAFEEIFSKRIQPKITAQPSVSSGNLTGAASVEAGTKITTANFSFGFDDGSYTYEGTTGVTATAWSVDRVTAVPAGGTSLNATGIATAASGSDTNGSNGFIIGDIAGPNVVSSLKYKATATHTAGNVAKDNLGSPSSPEIKIASGTKTRETAAYTPYRKPFWGYKSATNALANPAAITSDQVRGLQANGSSRAGLPASYTVPAGTKQVFFACEKGAKNNLSITNASALNAPVACTKVTDIMVKGANNFAEKEYTVWYVNLDAAFGGQAKLNLAWS